MRKRLSIYGILIALFAMSMVSYAIGVPFMPADDKDKNKNGKDTVSSQASTVILEEEEIPDSLLHPRWKIQRTTPITDDDLQESPLDLRRPENLEQKVEYNDTLERYIFGKKMGGTWINTPTMMTPEEYLNWSTRQKMKEYFLSLLKERKT